MNMMYSFLVDENEKLRKQVDELKNFLYLADVVCSHLLQDGDVTTQGAEAVKSLLLFTRELQDKYDKEAKSRGSST
jgi:hypothetical protein